MGASDRGCCSRSKSCNLRTVKLAVVAYSAGQKRVPSGSSAGGQFAGGGGSVGAERIAADKARNEDIDQWSVVEARWRSEAAHKVDKRGEVKVPTAKAGKTKARHKVDKRGGVVIHHPAYPDKGYQSFRQVLTTAGQVIGSRITGFA